MENMIWRNNMSQLIVAVEIQRYATIVYNNCQSCKEIVNKHYRQSTTRRYRNANHILSRRVKAYPSWNALYLARVESVECGRVPVRGRGCGGEGTEAAATNGERDGDNEPQCAREKGRENERERRANGSDDRE
ncbi:hypothetical protein J6590_017811 [Homalodisca vitripennis]|nr:hypothetical protein J6590_017811 [Homalodisca vitripennis]